VTTVVEVVEAGRIAGHYLADPRPAHPDRPWYSIGMVSSVDGATAVGGRSSALGGPPDLAAFRALRAVADIVMVGAGTARAEQYRDVRLPDDLKGWRTDRGMATVPRLALVSRSLRIEPTDELAASRPIVLTGRSADPGLRREVGGWAEVLTAGEDDVDAAEAARVLHGLGAAVVHAEGGPHLNGSLLAAGVVDEVAVTVAPKLVAGASSRIVVGEAPVRDAVLDRVIVSQGHLLLRYLL